MVMTAAGLAAAMKTAQGNAQDQTLQDDANLDLATAIIGYIQGNAVVTVTVAVDPGTHSGTGTGAIT